MARRSGRRSETLSPPPSGASFLDPVVLARLESMTVRARIIVEGALSGLHRARLHGSSVEFAEHKEYSPGDDTRHIDWRVFGKADRYVVKQFEQESELTCFLVLDASGSMAYQGDGVSKLEWASYLIAALAWLMIEQRDKVGLLVFGDGGLDRFVPPRARPSHLQDLLAVIDDVARQGARGDEPAAAALDRLGELTRRNRSLVVLASDLFERAAAPGADGGGRAGTGDERPSLSILRRLRAQRHDVAVFHTLDRDELELPFDELTMFEGLEDARELLANPAAIRRHYKAELGRFLARVEGECLSAGVDYRLCDTRQPLEAALLDFLVHRERGVRGRGGGPRAGSSSKGPGRHTAPDEEAG
jgi:uncharacterized protein (DUF58 family)